MSLDKKLFVDIMSLFDESRLLEMIKMEKLTDTENTAIKKIDTDNQLNSNNLFKLLSDIANVYNLTKSQISIDDLTYSIKLEFNDYELPHSRQFQNFIRGVLKNDINLNCNLGKSLIMRDYQEWVKNYLVQIPDMLDYPEWFKKYLVQIPENQHIDEPSPSPSPFPFGQSLSPYRGILLYHDMGTGKTLTAIHIAINFIQQYRLPLLISLNKKSKEYDTYNKGKVYLMFYKRLEPAWNRELEKYLTEHYDIDQYFKDHYDIADFVDQSEHEDFVIKVIDFIKENEGKDKIKPKQIRKYIKLIKEEHHAQIKFKNHVIQNSTSHLNTEINDYYKLHIRHLVVKDYINSHLHFIFCDPTAFLDSKLMQIQLHHNLLVIDEVHNVVHYIHTAIDLAKNETNFETKVGKSVYKWLMNAKDTKFVFLTGTPIINYPEEIFTMMNILKGPMVDEQNQTHTLFGTDNENLRTLFFDEKYDLLNPNLMIRRMTGLISRKIRDLSNDYPLSYWGINIEQKKLEIDPNNENIVELLIGHIRTINVPLSSTQFTNYIACKKKEKSRFSRSSNVFLDEDTTQSSLGMCTFPTYKNIIYKISTDYRSNYTGKVKKTDSDIDEPESDSDPETETETETELSVKDNQVFVYDIRKIDNYSPKISRILRTVLDQNNHDLHFIYSRWIIYSVFHIEAYLQKFGYEPYIFILDEDDSPSIRQQQQEYELKHLKQLVKQGRRFYIKYTDDYDSIVNGQKKSSHGHITVSRDGQNKTPYKITNQNKIDTINYIFNHKDNQHGDIIRLLIGTDKAKEGLDLKNIRQVYIMEPWWNMVRPEQAMGRAIRYLSHNDFANLEDRYVKIDMLISKMTADQINQQFEQLTSDQIVYQTAINKLKINKNIYELLTQSSIDCQHTCSNYFGTTETGNSFELALTNDIVDSDFKEYRVETLDQYQELKIDGVSCLLKNITSDPSNSTSFKIRFFYLGQYRENKAEYIFYRLFNQADSTSNIIIPYIAFVSEDKNYLQIKYPYFRII